MLTSTANELIGKGARIKVSDDPDLLDRQGVIDQIVLTGATAKARLLLNPPVNFVTVPIDTLEYCTCGEGQGCSICVTITASPVQPEVSKEQQKSTQED